MFNTDYGQFDGDRWEQFCGICFRLKYECEGFQYIPASPGDYGIEGFTRSGKAFQCYCPDFDTTSDDLYEKQRDKINTDLKKLETYEATLSKYLIDTKIKLWIFATPKYRKNDLVRYCREKANEYKLKNLSILDSNFDILVFDIDFFCREMPYALDKIFNKLDISPTSLSTNSDITKWKNQEISLIQNANRKNRILLPKGLNDIDKKVDSLTEMHIKNLLNGDIILKKWESIYPEDYERFLRVVGQVEQIVTIECMVPTENNFKKYKEFIDLLFSKLTDEFPNLKPTMIQDLCNRVIAFWIMQCPIDFE